MAIGIERDNARTEAALLREFEKSDSAADRRQKLVARRDARQLT